MKLLLGMILSFAGGVGLFATVAPELLPWYLCSALALLAGNALAKNAGAKNDV